MNCKTCRVEIEESDTAQPLSDGASVHLESCLNCRALRERHSALKKMIDSLEVVAAPADFDFRLRARLAAVRSEGRGQLTWSRFAPGAWSLAITAALVVIIAVGLMLKQTHVDPNANAGRGEVVNKNPDNAGSPSAPPVISTPKHGLPETAAPTSTAGLTRTVLANNPRRAGRGDEHKSQDAVRRANLDEGIRSVDLVSTSPAKSVLPPGIPDPLTQSRLIFSVPVRASMQPTTITFNDRGARPQTISLRPVTFGEQDVFELESAKKELVPTIQGIW